MLGLTGAFDKPFNLDPRGAVLERRVARPGIEQMRVFQQVIQFLPEIRHQASSVKAA
jgi:hypothetical protein